MGIKMRGYSFSNRFVLLRCPATTFKMYNPLGKLEMSMVLPDVE